MAENKGLRILIINPLRIGVVHGSGIGGMTTYEQQFKNFLERGSRRISPFFIPMLIPDMRCMKLRTVRSPTSRGASFPATSRIISPQRTASSSISGICWKKTIPLSAYISQKSGMVLNIWRTHRSSVFRPKQGSAQVRSLRRLMRLWSSIAAVSRLQSSFTCLPMR